MFKSTNGGESFIEVSAPTSSDIKILVTDPLNPDILYAGTGGGVLKSVDGGRSWRSANLGITNSNVSVIAIAPSQSATLYVGTYNSGIARSSDGGNSWTSANAGLTNANIWSLAIDPHDSAKVYAGTFQGIFKSNNGGTTWFDASRGLPNIAICSLALDPSNPDVLYATASDDGKAFKSTNGGDTWEEIRFRFPRLGGCGLVMNPADSSVLYATTYATATATSGILKSVDAGNTWKNDGSGSRAFSRLWVDLTASVVTDPANSATLYAGSSAGVFKSLDLGKTWMVVSTAFPTTGLLASCSIPSTPMSSTRKQNSKGCLRAPIRDAAGSQLILAFLTSASVAWQLTPPIRAYYTWAPSNAVFLRAQMAGRVGSLRALKSEHLESATASSLAR